MSRESYDFAARVAKARLEALLQLGPRPERGGEDEEGDDYGADEPELEEAPEPPVLLLLENGNGDGNGNETPSSLLLARHGSKLHLRMSRLLSLYGWRVEVVEPRAAKLALERAAAAEQARMKAAVEEATTTTKKRGGSDAAADASETDKGEEQQQHQELPLLWPPKPLPAHPPASAMPPGSVRACDAALRCEACGATVGLWSFVPSALCGGDGDDGEDGDGKGAAAAAAATNDATPPAAKRAKGASSSASPSPSPSAWTPLSSPNKETAAGPSRPRELDLLSPHRPWCPFVDSFAEGKSEKGKSQQRRRVGWRWTLAALVPAVAGDDEAGEGDARLLRFEEEEEREEESEKKANDDNAAAAASSPPFSSSSERATDRLRAALARAGILSPAAITAPSSQQPLVN